ncbi:MAG: hypothetical protein KDI56_16505 [Xanthomonadales bacterium]|nr:hypothetical protein [Xanthomonadales bacterium]
MFYTDGVQTRVIAMGCGALGGNSSTGQCGDPTPIGGTFSGMFIGTLFGPTTNDLGDVLFYSEVVGGSSPRGLFLYRADTSDIVKVATVGDISPLGGNLSAIGPGSINNNGWIVFLASTGGDGSQGSDILLWRNGVVTKYVASGDAAPGGEIFEYVGFEFGGWPDGSIIPFGPVPAINNSNQIAFTAWTQSTSGHVVSQNGQHAWLVQEGDPAPGGGFHSLFRQAVSINDNGLVAFQSDLAPTPGGTNNDAAWFVGSPGQFRRALGFSDTLLDGVVVALAWSRNPFRPLDEDGNLSLWATRQLPDQSYRETVIVSAPNGTFEIIANESEAAQTGGTWAYLNRWVNSNDAHQVQFGAEVAGNPNYSEAQFIATRFVDLILQDGFENVAEP